MGEGTYQLAISFELSGELLSNISLLLYSGQNSNMPSDAELETFSRDLRLCRRQAGC